MGSAQILNLGAAKDEIRPNPPQPVADEFTRDLRRLQTRVQRQEDEYDAHGRRTKVLSIVLGVLVVALLATIWLVYPVLREEKKALADILNLQNFSGTLSGQIISVEQNLQKMKADLPALSERFDKAQASMKANLQAVRNQVNRSLQAIESRVSGLESNQKESSDRVNKLQEQVTGLERELAAMRQKEAAANAEKIDASDEPPKQ
jgi:predicted PurR-regulated permease PerM